MEEYNNLLISLDRIINQPEIDKVFFASDLAVPYLYIKKEFATYSAWLGGNRLERLKQFYQLNPEKKPTVVGVDSLSFDLLLTNSWFTEIYAYFIESGYRIMNVDERMVYLSELSELTEEMDNLTDTELPLNPSTIWLQNAYIADNQFGGKPGIVCQGRLQRNSQGDEISLKDYLRENEYIGFEVKIEDMGSVQYITFYGNKTNNHGQPTVFIYDSMGNVIAKREEQYNQIGEGWFPYIIDVSLIEGPATIIFNGGYIDNTGNLDSQFIFSNIVFHGHETIDLGKR